MRDDNWEKTASSILEADILVFASPVYFHHLTAPLKTMMDRFRSFVHVQMTETGLIHTPWQEWNKDFVLILTMGSSDSSDADPIIELFRFVTSILGSNNRLHIITATRLGVVKQVVKSEEELLDLYKKLDLPVRLAKEDNRRNKKLLEQCRELGIELSRD
jgi:multimeric flavodoxin WrbA